MKKKLALALPAIMVLLLAPAFPASAATAPGGGGGCTDHVKVASSTSGLIWGSTSKVTNNTCGDAVEAYVFCQSDQAYHYGNKVIGDGTSSATCYIGSRDDYGYRIDKGAGWKYVPVG